MIWRAPDRRWTGGAPIHGIDRNLIVPPGFRLIREKAHVVPGWFPFMLAQLREAWGLEFGSNGGFHGWSQVEHYGLLRAALIIGCNLWPQCTEPAGYSVVLFLSSSRSRIRRSSS